MIDSGRQQWPASRISTFTDNVRDAPDIGSARSAVGHAKHDIERGSWGKRRRHRKQDTTAADIDDIGVTPDGVALGAHARR
jgi:hypothetical protein